MIYVSFLMQWCLEVLKQTKQDYECGRDWSQNTPLARESSMESKYTPAHTHTPLLPLQADDVTGYDGYKPVCVLVCIGAVFLCGVFVNQALLNLKIITFMTNQHHRRRSASCTKRKYTKPAREREREKEREWLHLHNWATCW